MVAAVLRQEAEIGAIGWLPLQRLGAFGAGSVSEAGPTAPSALLVVLRRDGVVQLFKPSGEMVLRFYAGHMHPVVPALAVGTDAAEHLLLTADTSGGIKAHKLVVRPSRRLDNVPRGQRVKPETVRHELGPGRSRQVAGLKKGDVEETTHDVYNNVFIDRLKQSARRAERQTSM
eukprot:TRINITY_DN8936_c0_g1_i6.p1 TRINITY_DN8936_c0_g1~~TRINITY_DN8936_c0_g1_i6.p1  ORF type:complete len:174 (+),score=21.13 TRINITY_DN8936_c0_g1_i6:104-625(+)